MWDPDVVPGEDDLTGLSPLPYDPSAHVDDEEQ